MSQVSIALRLLVLCAPLLVGAGYVAAPHAARVAPRITPRSRPLHGVAEAAVPAAVSLAAGMLGGSIGVGVAYPLDTVRRVLQVQDSVHAASVSGERYSGGGDGGGEGEASGWPRRASAGSATSGGA